MRYLLIALSLLLGPMASTYAEVSIGINIGIGVPVYPRLVLIPGYPVYYAPQSDLNYFFYDGLYWVYQNDAWYGSSWYNGPWQLVEPEEVPVFILRIPVRYYRRPPEYFRRWHGDEPPHWGERWGHDWEDRHRGWDRWNHRAPAPAPLPLYQRQYRGEHYPRSEEQRREIQSQRYNYQPREAVTRRHWQPQPNPRPEPNQQRPYGQPHYQPSPQPQQNYPRGEPRQQHPDNQRQYQPSPQPQQNYPRGEPRQQPPDNQRQYQQAPGQDNPNHPQDNGRRRRYDEHGQENQ